MTMTLIERLHELHRQGRIARLWAPGLLIEGEHDLNWTGYAHWRRVTAGWAADQDSGIMWARHSDGSLPVTNARVVVDDAATVGVLAAWARELHRDPKMHASPWGDEGDWVVWPDPNKLSVNMVEHQIIGRGRSEGAAWEDALLA